MGESYKEQLKISFLIVGLFFVVFLVLAFCYRDFFGKKKKVETEDFVVKFKSSDVLTIENKLPVADAIGKTFNGTGTAEGIQGYVEFSVQNINKEEKEYVILLTKQVKEEEMLGDYVKFYLTNEEDLPFEGFDGNVVPCYSNFLAYSKRPASRVLYTGKIDGKSELKFKLRVWLDDSYVISNHKEYFSIDIDVQ